MSADSPHLEEIQRLTQTVTVGGLIRLSSNSETSPEVRSRVDAVLESLREWLTAPSTTGAAEASHRAALADTITRYLDRGLVPAPLAIDAPEAPPGDPI
jgi:hypothetical protein